VADRAKRTEAECETLTHFAGIRMDICGRIVQRCTVCGAKLADSLNCAMPLNPDGSVPEFPTFAQGAIVQVRVGNPTEYRVLPDSETLPPDSCVEFI
jgi:hypothetical protein